VGVIIGHDHRALGTAAGAVAAPVAVVVGGAKREGVGAGAEAVEVVAAAGGAEVGHGAEASLGDRHIDGAEAGGVAHVPAEQLRLAVGFAAGGAAQGDRWAGGVIVADVDRRRVGAAQAAAVGDAQADAHGAEAETGRQEGRARAGFVPTAGGRPRLPVDAVA